jgi:ATP-dependent DNA ligase
MRSPTSGEAVSCGPDGIASFDRIRYRRHDADVFMWAFDLVELNGDDLRRARFTAIGTVGTLQYKRYQIVRT